MPYTEAPRSAKSCAVVAPSPADAPVINATLPSSCAMAKTFSPVLAQSDSAAWSRRRDRCQQCTGVVVLGFGEQLGGGPILDRLAVAHDQHVVAHLLDDGQIMADEQIREP